MTTRNSATKPSRAGGLLPQIPLDPDAAEPLYEQLYRALSDLIVCGQLAPGMRLASTRALAAELGLSRFTIVSSLDRLFAEGFLTARRGAGTFVAASLPSRMMCAPTITAPRSRERARQNTMTAKSVNAPAATPTMSARGEALTAVVITGPRSGHESPRPFHPRRPPLDVFPLRQWERLVRRQWSTYRYQHLDYGEPAGYQPLRAAIAQHIAITRGVRCTASQVVVTSGAQQAFDLLFRLLLDPRDHAWIEEPGYLDVRAALIGAGATLVPVPVDDQGIMVDAGIALARNARLCVVSPSHQYPTGATLSATRRAALLEWARTCGAWIIEDDYDSYFRYRGRPMTALHRLDDDTAKAWGCAPRVLYVGTFSKTMFPSLRLGYCVVPESLVDAVANARAVADRNSPIADQAALAEFIEGGHYDRHLRRVRLVCQERHEAMQFHFARNLSGLATLGDASAGTHVLARLHAPDGRRAAHRTFVRDVASAAAADDLVTFPLSRYCITPPTRDALVLGYGALAPRRIASGMEALAGCIERVRRKHS